MLRPMEERDLQQVLEWRNADRVRKFMYTDQMIKWEDHVAWFRRHQENEHSFAFVFEQGGQPIGVVNFTRNPRHEVCEWGFYRGVEDAPPGAATAMGVHALDFAFDVLGVRKVIGEVLAFNEGSLRYHERLGFVKEGHLKEQVLKNERPEDVIVYGLLQRRWQEHRVLLITGRTGGTP